MRPNSKEFLKTGGPTTRKSEIVRAIREVRARGKSLNRKTKGRERSQIAYVLNVMRKRFKIDYGLGGRFVNHPDAKR